MGLNLPPQKIGQLRSFPQILKVAYSTQYISVLLFTSNMKSRAIQPGVTKIGVNALLTLPIFTGIVPS